VGGKEIKLCREPRYDNIIERMDRHQINFFCDTDLGVFKVGETTLELHNTDPIYTKSMKEENDLWKMYFNGACSKIGNGAGVIFISPGGKNFKYSFLLTFKCTNNVAEYEALLIGLNIATKHKIKKLAIYGDSELVISQVREKYLSKNKRLRQYRNAVWDSVELFDAFSISWVDRSKNIMADF